MFGKEKPDCKQPGGFLGFLKLSYCLEVRLVFGSAAPKQCAENPDGKEHDETGEAKCF